MDAWDRLRHLFETDDGALYDIRLMELDDMGLRAAFEFLRARSAVTPEAVFWHNGLEQDQLVANYPDVAWLVACGLAQPFHVLACGLKFTGAVVPDLGVFVWPDEITLDYRMGPEWGRPQLIALFELLRQLATLTGGKVSLDRYVLPHVNDLFVGEWAAYCSSVAGR